MRARTGACGLAEELFFSPVLRNRQPGPVNTCFGARVAARKSVRAGREAQGIVAYGQALQRRTRVFSYATRRDGTEFHPTHRYSLLAELTLLRGSCLVPAEIRPRRGRETSVNRP